MANILEKFRDKIVPLVNYEHVSSFLISNGLVTEQEDKDIKQASSVQEQMSKCLDIISGRASGVDAFIAALEMCDQRKIYGDLSNKLLSAKFS